MEVVAAFQTEIAMFLVTKTTLLSDPSLLCSLTPNPHFHHDYGLGVNQSRRIYRRGRLNGYLLEGLNSLRWLAVEAEDDEFRWYIKSLQGEYVRKGSFVSVMRYNIGLITYPDSALLFYISYYLHYIHLYYHGWVSYRYITSDYECCSLRLICELKDVFDP